MQAIERKRQINSQTEKEGEKDKSKRQRERTTDIEVPFIFMGLYNQINKIVSINHLGACR